MVSDPFCMTSRWAALRACSLFLALLMYSGHGLAHGINMEVWSEGAEIAGMVRYADGEFGSGVSIRIEHMSAPERAQHMVQADANGLFSFRAIMGEHYRVTALDEGRHRAVMAITVGAGPAVQLSSGSLPVYVVLGILLLLSTIPAWYYGRQTRS